MTVIEQTTLEILKWNIPTIAKELKRANRLKAFELKMKLLNAAHGSYSEDGEKEIDEIMED